MMLDDLPQSTLLSAFDGARLIYFDGMFPETAIFVAQEVIIIFFFLRFFHDCRTTFFRYAYC